MSTSNVSCTPLSAFTLCGSSFSGYPVDASINFGNTIRSYLNVDSIASLFSSSFGCKGTDILLREVNKLRYFGSMRCVLSTYSVITYSNCSVPNGFLVDGPLLCEPLCRSALLTLVNLFQNTPDACQPVTADSEQNVVRNRVLASFQELCDRAKARTSSTYPCWNGMPAETNLCGFRDTGYAGSYCATNSSDSCCASVPKLPTQSVQNDTSASSASSDSSKMVAITASVTSVIFVIAVVVVGLFYYKFKHGTLPLMKQSEHDTSSEFNRRTLLSEAASPPRMLVIDNQQNLASQSPLPLEPSTLASAVPFAAPVELSTSSIPLTSQSQAGLNRMSVLSSTSISSEAMVMPPGSQMMTVMTPEGYLMQMPVVMGIPTDPRGPPPSFETVQAIHEQNNHVATSSNSVPLPPIPEQTESSRSEKAR